MAVKHGIETEKRIRPIVIEIGAEPQIESLQDGLRSMEIGDTREIPDPHDDLRWEFDRNAFESMMGEAAELGHQVVAQSGELGAFVDITEATVTVDFYPDRSE